VIELFFLGREGARTTRSFRRQCSTWTRDFC